MEIEPMRRELKKLAQEIQRARIADARFFYKPAGKKLLQKALGMNLSWDELAALFSKSLNTMRNVVYIHGLKKTRPVARRTNWPISVEPVIKDFYLKSRKVRNKAESGALTWKMLEAVNRIKIKDGFAPATLAALRCFIYNHPDLSKLRWGYPRRCAPENVNNVPLSSGAKKLLKWITPS